MTGLRGCAVALGVAVASVNAATGTTNGRRRVMAGVSTRTLKGAWEEP
jgi:hypothetical protein